MAGDKRETIWLVFLGVLVLLVPVFWSTKSQDLFLYPKELLVKYYATFLLCIGVSKYNKYLSLITSVIFVHSFLNLTTRALWALSNIRDFLIIYLLVRILIKPDNIKYVLWLWLVSLLIPFMMAWMQYKGIDFLPRAQYSEVNAFIDKSPFHGEYWPISAFFGNPHIVMAWFSLCSPLVFLLPPNISLWAGGVLLISVIIFGSRGGHLITYVFGVSSVFVMLNSKKDRIIKFFLISVPSLMILLGMNFKNFLGFLKVRKEIIQAILPKILEHPFWGHGFNSFNGLRIRLKESGTLEKLAHNEFIQLYTEVGLVSLLVIPAIIYYFRTLPKLKQKEGKILFGLFVTFLCSSLYSFPFHLAYSALFFFTILALSDTLIEKEFEGTA